MRICIDSEALKKNESNLKEVIVLLSTLNGYPIDEDYKSLLAKGLIATDYVDGKISGYRVTNKGSQFLDDIVADSDITSDEKSLETLASKLKEIFPKGKKDGTNLYWADGNALIVRRLKLFFKKYGEVFEHDQIITAAQKYIEGFNGNYKYMQILKYFIFKEKRGIGGDIEGESQLINYIENSGQEDSLKDDWTNTLV